jgi:hypothetical protein
LAEVNPAAEAPMWLCPRHHHSVRTNAVAVVERGWVGGVCTGFRWE